MKAELLFIWNTADNFLILVFTYITTHCVILRPVFAIDFICKIVKAK